jgi:hypothetical protein
VCFDAATEGATGGLLSSPTRRCSKAKGRDTRKDTPARSVPSAARLPAWGSLRLYYLRMEAQQLERVYSGSLVHLGENNPSLSDLERTAHIRPLERLGHRSVEVLHELEDAPVQILHGGEAAPLEESARQNREP